MVEADKSRDGDATAPMRRGMIRSTGIGLAGIAAAGLLATSTRASAATTAYTDTDLFNFLLNFEYLGANYYLHAVTGEGLSAYTSVTGVGKPGEVVGGALVPFQTPAIAHYAQQLANDELAHAEFIRELLGTAVIAQPAVDIADSWTVLAQAAGLITPGQAFNPFENEVNFLLGAYALEDVCVTGLTGAAALLSDPTNIAYAASLLGAEGYHGGAIRGFLSNIGAGVATNAISNLRAKLSGVADNGTDAAGNPFNITNVDQNGQAYRRTPSQVLSILYGNNASGTASGLFFPFGVNGTITTV